MTHFIDCYQSLDTQLHRLSISEQSSQQDHSPVNIPNSSPNPYTDQILSQNSQQISTPTYNTTQIIIDIISRTNLRHIAYQQNPDKNSIQINGLYDAYQCYGFDIYCKIVLNFDTCQIYMSFSLWNNFIPFTIKNKNHRLLVNKFLLKCNVDILFGSFRLDPSNGELYLLFSFLFTTAQFQEIFCVSNKNFDLISFMNNQYEKARNFYLKYMLKILFLINQAPQSFVNNPQISTTRIRTVCSHYKKTKKILSKIIPTMHLQYSFMYSDKFYTGNKDLSLTQNNKLTGELIRCKNFSKGLVREVVDMCKIWVNLDMVGIGWQGLEASQAKGKGKAGQVKKGEGKEAGDGLFTEDDKKGFGQRLADMSVKYQTGEPANTFCKIQVTHSPNVWDLVDQGGFGRILKGIIKFAFQEHIDKCILNKESQQNSQTPKIFTKCVVKKQDYDPQKNKITHQKQILQYLKNTSCPFIGKFYHSDQPEYKDYLLLEYCFQKSLSLLKLRTGQFLSLQSKLLILCNIAQGIKYLKDNQIYHLDIKPSNILYHAGHVKIIDFGEAYHEKVCNRNYRPGTSIPYAPPQSLTNGLINFHSKMDVFSFGVVMYEMLFDCYPFDYSRAKYDMFKAAYMKKDYMRLMFQAPEKTDREGFAGILYLLKYVAFRCMQQDEKKRPCIEWIICSYNCISDIIRAYNKQNFLL